MKLSTGWQAFLQWALVVTQIIASSYMPDEKSRMVATMVLSITQKYLAGEAGKRDMEGNRLPDPKAPPLMLVPPPTTLEIDTVNIKTAAPPK